MSKRFMIAQLDEIKPVPCPCGQARRAFGEEGNTLATMHLTDIFADAQYRARNDMLQVADPRAGDLVLPAAVPRLSETPAVFRHAGRALGEDTAEVLGRLLGIEAAELQALSDAGVI